MGKSSSPPPAPDYTAAAQAQGVANVETAKTQGVLNNPNIISPYGTQTVTWGGKPVGGTLDQPGYQAAVDAWHAAGGRTGNDIAPNGMVAPKQADYMTVGGTLQPTVTQTLSPAQQKILDANQQTQLGLANLGQQALSTAQSVMGSPINYAGQIQTSLGNYNPIQASVANAGAISQAPDASKYGSASGLAGNAYGSAGSVGANQYGLASGGPSGNAYGSAGGIAGNAYGLANGKLDLSNIANLPVNAGQTGQAAIMSRLQPQIQAGDQAYAAQLANQGIVQGSEAYNNAMRVHNQANNDLLTQAALQGIGLDFQANNQGFNQALQQGQFGNQALAQNFGQGLAGQQLTNQAIAQNFGQGQAAAAMQNAAIGQNFGQGLQAQNQANQAIGQNFNQGLQGQQLTNQAIGQNFAQGLASQQAQNAAQAQQYGQNLNNAQLYNQAQNQAFNQGLAGAQFGNTAQQQALQQALTIRELPLNEISALMSGSQVQNPQFQAYQGSQVAPAPLFNAVQAGANNALQNYSIDSANQNSFMNGLFGLGSAGMNAYALKSLSDRRLKSNIKRIGTHPLGIGIYSYEIFGEPDIGVMADEVLQVKPDAVGVHPSGFMMVDYGSL